MRGQLSVEIRQRGIITRLTNENKKLRNRVKELEKQREEGKASIEELKLQVKALQKVIFGKKHSGDKNDDISASKPPRNKSSYRRPIPNPQEITKIELYSIDTCPDCGTFLISKITLVRYIIDIILPYLNEQTGVLETPARTVIKQTIEKGWCSSCQAWHTAKIPDHSPPIKNNEVLLGDEIKKFVSFQSNIIRDTYTQIQDELIGLYNIKISQGEIANILGKTSNKLSPEYERLKK